jgi:hypothetical protein
MGLPVNVPLIAYRGDTWTQQFRFLDAPNTPHDLTGATVAAWATSKTDPKLVLTVAVGPDPGVVNIGLPATVAADQYKYDVEVTDTDGTVTTWVRGNLGVTQDVTNAP